MSIEKLDLAIKEFDPRKQGFYDGTNFKREAFIQLYINKLYGDQLHNIQFTEIFILFTKEYGNYDFIEHPFLWDKNKRTVYDLNEVPEEYIQEYRKTNKRFTLYPISLTDIKQDNSHVLYMLYDKKFNQIEVFDNTYNINVILTKKHMFFTNFFKKIYGAVKFHYQNYGCIISEYVSDCYKSNKYLYKSYGYCSIWFLWFLELRLKNRTLTTKQIVNKIKEKLQIKPEILCEILIGYAQFVDKVTNDYKYVIIDHKINRISLKSSVKQKKRRITGIIAGLITLLSSAFLLQIKFNYFFKKPTKSIK
jgi:hypothetical protein